MAGRAVGEQDKLDTRHATRDTSAVSNLLNVYRAFHQQAFAPIFVGDELDSRMLVDACVEAGMKVIEYTLRRRDVREMIPWIRKTYPELKILVGSTIDDEAMVRAMRRRHPHLLTVAELSDMGVDGFVSMLGWSKESIRIYSPTHLVVPSAMTVTEAFNQTCWGAHFQKISGQQLDLVRRCRATPTFDFCPIFITGGMTVDGMKDGFHAGGIAVAAGFDAILKGKPSGLPPAEITAILRAHVERAQALQRSLWPELAAAADGADAEWLAALPHWHPFD